MIRDRLARREESLLDICERAIYSNPRSPYRKLLAHLGIELGDIAALLRDHGVEGALSRLYESGVRITIDELKGLVPIRRPGFELAVENADFDNPLLLRHYETRTGGSRSAGNRVSVDLDLLSHDAAYTALFLAGFGVQSAPYATWQSDPASVNRLLPRAKLGLPSEAWFSQGWYPAWPAGLKWRLLTSYTIAAARLHGRRMPHPRQVPLQDSARIARWLAHRVDSGSPALLEANWSAAVRTCLAAREEGLDLSGTLFRVGGESGTPLRAKTIEATGSRFASHYGMSEVSYIGIACPERRALDEVHLMTEKVAVIQSRRGGPSPADRALQLTTLLPSSPKIFLNVDTGDHAVITERSCGCPLGELGLTMRAHAIASHEKLTCEEMTFTASEISWLLEEALPERLGGNLADYQLVEEQTDTLPRVSVLVSPAVGELEEGEIVRAVLESLSSRPTGGSSSAPPPGHRRRESTPSAGGRLTAERLRQAGTLRVLRREPYVTPGGKVQPLHVVRPTAGS